MSKLNDLYRPPLALLTDLYQLTMAYGYWKLGRAEQESVFHLFFRKPPFQGGYAMVAGLETALEFLSDWQFADSDIEYLASIKGNDNAALFEAGFLDYLAKLRLTCDIDAMPEGTVAFGHEPLLRVRGPILQAQLLETPLLNIINFQTLIATKSARICQAAQGEPVLEFGLRRAQGIDGSLSASRAAYIGGCAATSNVLAGKLYDIPVKGTHAHSWVMSFDTEREAFDSYAEVMPNNCVFLVDTYDTVEGVRQAVEVGNALRKKGHEMVGVRLDSGDLAHLSIEARKILDEGGFPKASIVASNDLSEQVIESLKLQGAKIAVWGVGTKLATSFDQPALGGVYKLGAIRGEDGEWKPKVKLSEQAIKTSIPGTLQVRRYEDRNGMSADMIYDQNNGIDPRATMVNSGNPAISRIIIDEEKATDLLQPVVNQGEVVCDSPSIHAIRERSKHQLESLDVRVKRFLNPQSYFVGLDVAVHELRQSMAKR